MTSTGSLKTLFCMSGVMARDDAITLVFVGSLVFSRPIVGSGGHLIEFWDSGGGST